MKEYSKNTINYYNSIAEKYIKSDAAIVVEDRINQFIGFLGESSSIIDIGCGPGHDTNYLSEKGFSALGIDLSDNMIDLARQNNKGQFQTMDFLNMDLQNNLFDGAWCSSVLVHIRKTDVPNFFDKVSKILKPNGILGIITAQKQRRVIDPSDTRTYVMYERNELESYLKQSGFEILVSDSFPYGGKNRLFIISKNVKRK